MGYYEESLYASFLGNMHPDVVEKEENYNEDYIGRLPEFEAIADLFEKMKAKAEQNPKAMNPNKWEENDKICKIFAKVFGLKAVWFYWIPEESINAYTINVHVLTVLGDSKDLVKYTKGKGFYDTTHRMVFTVYGYCSLLKKEVGLTGRQLLAIFLHEFGHNFDYSPYLEVKYVADCTLGSSGSTIDENNSIKMDEYDRTENQYAPYYNSKDNTIRDNKANRYHKAIENYNNTSTWEIAKDTIKMLVHMPKYALYGRRCLQEDIVDKKGEQFADSFATAYGYGPELIAGLNRLEEVNTSPQPRTSKVDIFFRDLNNCLYEIIIGMIDVHGTHQERCKDCIKKLKRDLANSDYPAGMKKDLEREIAQLEKIYQGMLTASPNDRDKITKRWRRFVDRFFGGAFNSTRKTKPNQM